MDTLNPNKEASPGRNSATRLGQVFLMLSEQRKLPLGRWALPGSAENKIEAALSYPYPTRNKPNNVTALQFYQADYDAVIPRLRAEALAFAEQLLKSHQETLEKLKRDLDVNKTMIYKAVKNIQTSTNNFFYEEERQGTAEFAIAQSRGAPHDAQPDKKQIKELLENAHKRNQRIGEAVAAEKNVELSILFNHPKGGTILRAYSKSEEIGTSFAKELVNDALEEITKFRNELQKDDQRNHVWRYPPLVMGGVVRLGFEDVLGFGAYAVQIGQVLGYPLRKVEVLIGVASLAFLIVGLVFAGPIAAAVIGVVDLALAGAGATLAYLREREHELAANATAFKSENEKVAVNAGYGDTIINSAFALLSAIAFFTRGMQLKQLTQREPIDIGNISAREAGRRSEKAVREQPSMDPRGVESRGINSTAPVESQSISPSTPSLKHSEVPSSTPGLTPNRMGKELMADVRGTTPKQTGIPPDSSTGASESIASPPSKSGSSSMVSDVKTSQAKPARSPEAATRETKARSPGALEKEPERIRPEERKTLPSERGLGELNRRIHPKKLDVVGDSRLAEAVHDHRLSLMDGGKLDKAENLAGIEYVHPVTQERKVIFGQSSKELGIHAEKDAVGKLKADLGDDFSFDVIKKFYTERKPCRLPGYECHKLLVDNLPRGTRVEYMFDSNKELLSAYSQYDKRGRWLLTPVP